MIRVNEKLTVYYDDNSSFTDISREMAGYGRDTSAITFVSAEDFIYIGFYKPINTFYIDLSAANTNSATLALSYYNGSSYTAVTGLYDDTNGFNRSGFVTWDRGLTDEAKATVNSTELYWYRLHLDADSSAMDLSGLNIVFSDDQDLKRHLFEISSYLPSGESSHILTHEAARDEIIQSLNLKGRYKTDATLEREVDITAFDLLDVSEVKLASTYLVLSKILMNVSDQVDDVYLQKSQIYASKYNQILNAMDLSVDLDDDGKADPGERAKFGYGFIKRL